VSDITWRNSTIKTREENIVVIPNAKLAQAIVTNYYLTKREVMVRIPVGVSYSSDLEKVEEVTVDVARETLENFPDAVKDFTPKVLFHTFNDSSIDMTVVMKVKEYLSRRQFVHEFIKRLHKRYNKEGIVIPFPIRTVDYMDKSKS
jgi:small-conductance mechanosensitive channel